jgi:hypothetical protein
MSITSSRSSKWVYKLFDVHFTHSLKVHLVKKLCEYSPVEAASPEPVSYKLGSREDFKVRSAFDRDRPIKVPFVT